jgi:hypothetical protein
MKRNVFYLYKKVLQKNHRIVNLAEFYKFYDDYIDLFSRWEKMPETMTIVGYISAPNMPKYLKWARELI